MKRLFSLVLASVMVLALFTACGSSGETAEESESTATAEAQEESETTETQEGSEDTETTETTTETPTELKLAVVGPMTGDNSHYGMQFERGVAEALEVYNAQGGTQVTYDLYDDKNDAKEAVNIANMIISSGEDYLAVIGPFSSTCALAMCEILDAEKILQLSPSCSHVDYIDLYDYTYRLVHVNSDEGISAADYCVDEFGATKIAGIYSNNDWGLAVDEAFANEVEARGAELVANESFIQGSTKDFSATLTKIMASGAEAIYYMGQYTECGQLLNQIKDLGLDIDVLVTTSSFTVESLQLAGDAAEGVVFMTMFLNDGTNPETVAFEELVMEKYGVSLDNFIMRAYDSTNWLLDAFDATGSTDPDVLGAEMLEIGMQTIYGIGGEYIIGEDRQCTRGMIYTRWNGLSGDDAYFERIE